MVELVDRRGDGVEGESKEEPKEKEEDGTTCQDDGQDDYRIIVPKELVTSIDVVNCLSDLISIRHEEKEQNNGQQVAHY